MKTFCLTGIFISITALCNAQQLPETETDLSHIADDLIGFQDEDADYEDIYENLMQVVMHPLDLNKATAEDLRLLYILSEKQIQSLLRYREETGNLVSVHELQAVPDFDLATIHRLLPLIKVTDPADAIGVSLLKRITHKQNSYLVTRYERTVEPKKGFRLSAGDKNQFRGTPERLYMRFRNARPGDFSFGFTADKDAGEPLKWDVANHQYGVDFISYHAQLLNKGKIRNLIVGDFQCQFGQGLILGSAFGLGKGAETIITARRSNIGFLPYASVNESGFYRGIAVTYEISRNIFLSGFYSGTRRDATLENDSLNAGISSFQNSGLHRSESELAHRQKIMEKSYGAILNYKNKNLDAGLIFHALGFGTPVNKSPSAYNQFTFNGNQNFNAGAFVNYNLHNFNFFSEVARSVRGGTGIIAGLLAALHTHFDVSIVFRNYDKDYYTFYANAFAENSSPQNETGLYWGWKYTWNKKYSITGYTDLFKFPWLGFRRYAPSHGYEWLFRFNYRPGRNLLMFAQVREESKARNLSGESNLYLIGQGIKRNYWLVLEYSTSEHLKLRTRAQYSTFSIGGKDSQGMVLLQDLIYSAGKFQLSARHAVFDTDDYDNRHYVYENDVWMAFSFPAYAGTGIRNYIVASYQPGKALTFSARYARTRYTNIDEIGSGIEAIEGNIKNDIKFQVLFRF